MNIDILKLIDGSPALIGDGWVSLAQAAQLTGISTEHLLEASARGSLALYLRMTQVPGYVVSLVDLADPAVMPQPRDMPATAVADTFTGVLPVSDACQVATSVIGSNMTIVEIAALDVPGKSGVVFVPDSVITIEVPRLEVSKRAVEALRATMAKAVSPGALDRAMALRASKERPTGRAEGKWAAKPYSYALRQYCSRSDGLPNTLADSNAQRQRENGLLLFSEFMGDIPLGEIDGDKLRAFRDGPLKRFPNHANRLKKEVRRDTMAATIEALSAIQPDYERMTLDQQKERMQWLFRFFAWLHEKGYLSPNPATTLVGEDGRTKAERIAAKQSDEEDEGGRRPFSPEELAKIFSVAHYQTGRGTLVKGNEAWYPFQYWLPLLGLYAGCRIKECSQLHLDDILEIDGVWVIDINRRTADKSLKTDASVRRIPVHSDLIELGFIEYCKSLRSAGYKRLFPELTYSNSSARYAKESGRKMSAMLKKLGMARDGTLVYHCLRHNLNDALARVSTVELKDADEKLRLYVRYRVIGHELPDDVNARHYTTVKVSEMNALLSGVKYTLPKILPFDIEFGLAAVSKALEKKMGARKGKEDMGPLKTAESI